MPANRDVDLPAQPGRQMVAPTVPHPTKACWSVWPASVRWPEG